MITIKNLIKNFDKKEVLRDISFNIKKGEIHFIIGRSGSGKTVLAKHIVGLLSPTTGEIFLNELKITGLTEREFFKVRKKISYVFQHSTLFDFMTVYQNVEFPILKNSKKLKKEKLKERVNKYIKELKLESFIDKYPSEIGLATQKKVAIARALAMEPEYIIYDEPTTGLEYTDARDIDKMIFNMSRKLDVTAIVISHDLESIFSIADKITLIDNGKLITSSIKSDFIKSDNKIIKELVELHENS